MHSRLLKLYEFQTNIMSSTEQMLKLSCAKHIIDLGLEVVPEILQEMKTSTGAHWMALLGEIYQGGPVIPEKVRGNIVELSKIWIHWVEQKDESTEGWQQCECEYCSFEGDKENCWALKRIAELTAKLTEAEKNG